MNESTTIPPVKNCKTCARTSCSDHGWLHWVCANWAQRRPSGCSISSTLRFRVFERDRFTCQYCGRSAPEVELHCDHIYPWSRGGPTTIENLTTACRECNLGKSDRVLHAGMIDPKDEVNLRSSQLERANNRLFVKQLTARIADHMRVR